MAAALALVLSLTNASLRPPLGDGGGGALEPTVMVDGHHPGTSSRSRSGSNRTAIVLLMGDLDGCHACRAQAVVESLDAQQDLWVLHKRTPQDVALVADLRRRGAFVEPQEAVPSHGGWESFGSEASGYSKSAFIRWVVRHPEYRFAWQLEDDVFYTGRWGDLFRTLDQAYPTTSLLSKQSHDTGIPNGVLSAPTMCHMPGGSEEDFSSCVSLRRANASAEVEQVHLHVLWFLTRVTPEWATTMFQALDREGIDGARGHHEAITGPLCEASPECTDAPLPSSVLGSMLPGHWPFEGSFFLSDPTKQTLEQVASTDEFFQHRRGAEGRVRRGLLYHPAKCEAAHDVAEKALAWAGINGGCGAR